jgi:hypothetical protein
VSVIGEIEPRIEHEADAFSVSGLVHRRPAKASAAAAS